MVIRLNKGVVKAIIFESSVLIVEPSIQIRESLEKSLGVDYLVAADELRLAAHDVFLDSPHAGEPCPKCDTVHDFMSISVLMS
jgi:hypothetical protein